MDENELKIASVLRTNLRLVDSAAQAAALTVQWLMSTDAAYRQAYYTGATCCH